MRRVCVVITARPSYSRVKSVLEALKSNPDVDLQTVVAASALLRRYGQVVDQIREDGFTVSSEISCVLEGGGVRESALSTSVFLAQITATLDALRPDVVVTIADRHETLATAIAAAYQNIPLCHIQGGEVSGSIDDKVRDAITQLADIHCVSTERAGINVQRMKPDADIHVTGCPSIDLAKKAVDMGPLIGAPEIVVLQHPDTTQAHLAGWQMRQTIDALRQFDDRVLWLWPGEDAGSDAMSKALRLADLTPKRNLSPLVFLRTLLGAKVLVGNSSVGIRECSFMGVPVVNIGTRQQGRERGPNVVDVGHDPAAIRRAVYEQMMAGAPRTHLYGDGRSGQRIAEILAAPVRNPALAVTVEAVA